MKLKIIALTLAVLFAVASLAGCSPADPNTDVPPEPDIPIEDIPNEPLISEPSELSLDIRDEYPELPEDTVLEYADEEEVRNMLNNGTGVVFFTWSDCPWCHKFSRYLDAAAQNANVGKVLCYDLHDDRENQTEFYEFLVEKLGSFLAESGAYDADGNLRIYVPELVFVVEGDVIAHENSTSMFIEGEENVETFWDEIDENGEVRGEVFVRDLCEPFNRVCEALDKITHRGCESCVAARPDKGEEESIYFIAATDA